jgi:hypothetical protein
MIPLNLFLLAWVWFGRVAFGAYGWFLVLMLYVVPFLFLAMLMTTVLSFRRSTPPRSLTRSQALAQLTMWAAMVGFGFFLVDFGDVDNSDLSAFTQVVGRNDTTLSISWTITGICAAVAVVAWLFLLVLLVAQKRDRAQVAYA